MNEYLVAILLGLSFGNLWVCALLVFSLQTTNRLTCAGYLVGRVIAITALAVIVAVIGKMVFVPQTALNIFSGVLLIGFAGYLAMTRIFQFSLPWKKQSETHIGINDCGDHDCHSCPTAGHHEYQEACQDCATDKICEAEEPEVEPLTREARVHWSREVTEDRPAGFAVGMTLGAVRGATMCHKLVVLVPILLGVSAYKAAGLGLSFSLSSTIYPLLGFVFGAFALKLVKYKKTLFVVSCVLLLVVGLRYLYKGIIA